MSHSETNCSNSQDSEGQPKPKELMIQKTIKYLKRSLDILLRSSQIIDCSRITLAYFGINSLSIMGHPPDYDEKERAIRWIKSLYIESSDSEKAGFAGGNYLRVENDGHLNKDVHLGNIAATYTAIATLKILGDDLSDLNFSAIANGLKILQKPDGSFNSSSEGGENDMRFVYCASAICRLIGDWSQINIDSAVDFILKSISYEGAMGQDPYAEAHGGSTYCAVASLKLMDKLNVLSSQQYHRLVRWCVNRLNDGFNGRPNKDDDTCYGFWIGATLKILEPFPDVDKFLMKCCNFALENQDNDVGGIGKVFGNSSDPLHTNFGLSSLALMGYPGLEEVDPTINIIKSVL